MGEERVWKLITKTCAKLTESVDAVVSVNKKNKYALSQKDSIKAGRKPKTLWIDLKYSTLAPGTILISTILVKNVFDYIKTSY